MPQVPVPMAAVAAIIIYICWCKDTKRFQYWVDFSRFFRKKAQKGVQLVSLFYQFYLLTYDRYQSLVIL